MIPHTALTTDTAIDYLNIAVEDRDEALALLEGTISPAAARVQDYLLERLGTADDSVPELGTAELPVTERDWLEAMLRFVPALLQWHAQQDIPDAVTRDTLADFGRHMAINRRVHGQFGMDTYKWLTHVFAGRIFQLGRLQYLIHQPTAAIPGVAAGEWILGIHIPEDGGLSHASVAESLASAVPFFATHFPGRPVTTGNCESWLLDPYLAAHIDEWSNIFLFSRPTRNRAMSPRTPCTSRSAPAAWKTWTRCRGPRRCNGWSWTGSPPGAPGSLALATWSCPGSRAPARRPFQAEPMTVRGCGKLGSWCFAPATKNLHR
jgi:hypothetical protein